MFHVKQHTSISNGPVFLSIMGVSLPVGRDLAVEKDGGGVGGEFGDAWAVFASLRGAGSRSNTSRGHRGSTTSAKNRFYPKPLAARHDAGRSHAWSMAREGAGP